MITLEQLNSVLDSRLATLKGELMEGFRMLDAKIDKVEENLSKRIDDMSLRMATKDDISIIHRRILKLEERV